MLKINYELAKEKMLNGEGNNHVKIEINPSPNEIKSKRELPVAVMLCIDNSGSMSSSLNGNYINQFVNAQYVQPQVFMQHQLANPYNQQVHSTPVHNNYQWSSTSITQHKSKMDYAKESAIQILNALKDYDYFGVVVFDNRATTIVELQKIGTKKSRMLQAIHSINVGGSTNMYDGLLLVENEFKKVEASNNVAKKLLILSDGEVNCGETNLDKLTSKSHSLFHKNQIQVSTIGFGHDYNLELMSSLANTGEGGFYHIKESEEIFKIIEVELDTINSISASQVKLEVTIPTGFSFEENINGFNESYLDNKIFINFGNVAFNKSIIFPIQLLKMIKQDEIKIPITVTYIDKENNTVSIQKDILIPIASKEEKIKENETLVRELTEYIYNNAIVKATIEYENNGRYATSQNYMSSNLQSISSSYSCADSISSSLDNFTNTMNNSISSKDQLRTLNSSSMKSLKK